jgi:lipoprotein-releasing system ATP-binding protein
MNNNINDKVLVATDIVKTFNDGKNINVKVLQGTNIIVTRGEMVAILGASGSGKSTLMHIIGGLDFPDSGKIEVLGQDLSKLDERARAALRNKSLGFVYQFHHLLPEFNALENVMMPLLIGGSSNADAAKLAIEIIDEVGLASRAQHKIAELSGGERQRIALARALVTKPACVLADEPTGNLDTNSADNVFKLMRKLNKSFDTAFIIVTHDQLLAAQMDRSLYLRNGILQNS